MTASTASTVAKRHPIRGGLYGIVLGLGLALLFIGRKIVTLDSAVPIILVVVGIVIGVLWGMFAPAKKPKGRPPRSVDRRREEEEAEAATTAAPVAEAAAGGDESPDGPGSGDGGGGEMGGDNSG